MKRMLSIFLALSLLLATAISFSGCDRTEQNPTLSRAAWIEMLAKHSGLTESASKEQLFSDVAATNPYYHEIQSCAEWKIIEKTGEFKPEEDATNAFAITSAIKAIGVARLEKSDYKASLQSDEALLSFFEKQSGLKLSANKVLTREQADELMAKMQGISAGMTLPQSYNVDYKNNVKQMESNQVSFSADGKTATLKSGAVGVGDIIAIEPSSIVPKGKYVKVSAKNGNSLTYRDASLDEIFDDYDISGTFDAKVLAVRPLASGVTVDSIGNAPVVANQSYIGSPSVSYIPVSAHESARVAPVEETFKNPGSASASIDVNLGGGMTAKGTVKVDIQKITIEYGKWVDLNFNGRDDTKSSYVRIDDTVSANIEISGKAAKSIDLIELEASAYGVVGLSGTVSLNIGVDGSVSVGLSVKTSASAEVEPWEVTNIKFTTIADDPTVTYDVNVHAYVKPSIRVSVEICQFKIAWVGVSSGLEGQAMLDGTVEKGRSLACIDLKLWIPLEVFFGFDVRLASKEKTQVIWTSKSSPWHPHIHIENGVVVEKCTMGQETSDDTEYGAEPDKSFRPLKEPEYLILSSYYVSLASGGTDTLLVSKLPAGYTARDLVFSSDRPRVVSVSQSGILTSVDSGMAIIRIATKDSKYEQFCAVSSPSTGGNSLTPVL